MGRHIVTCNLSLLILAAQVAALSSQPAIAETQPAIAKSQPAAAVSDVGSDLFSASSKRNA